MNKINFKIPQGDFAPKQKITQEEKTQLSIKTIMYEPNLNAPKDKNNDPPEEIPDFETPL